MMCRKCNLFTELSRFSRHVYRLYLFAAGAVGCHRRRWILFIVDLMNILNIILYACMRNVFFYSNMLGNSLIYPMTQIDDVTPKDASEHGRESWVNVSKPAIISVFACMLWKFIQTFSCICLMRLIDYMRRMRQREGEREKKTSNSFEQPARMCAHRTSCGSMWLYANVGIVLARSIFSSSSVFSLSSSSIFAIDSVQFSPKFDCSCLMRAKFIKFHFLVRHICFFFVAPIRMAFASA